MLEKTRFREHFEFIGNLIINGSIFEGCGKGIPLMERVLVVSNLQISPPKIFNDEFKPA